MPADRFAAFRDAVELSGGDFVAIDHGTKPGEWSVVTTLLPAGPGLTRVVCPLTSTVARAVVEGLRQQCSAVLLSRNWSEQRGRGWLEFQEERGRKAWG